MASQAQINANRRNAQKSTGPKTTEGKQAVSQNAAKHGLFAHEAVIYGESQADFELHRETLLAEWRPVGPTETMLAERIVGLSWRLQRIERMESQAIDNLIIHAADDDKLTRSFLERETRRTLSDSGTLDRDLMLGQAVVKDFASYRVLDRLTLYERRMENSIHNAIRLLKKLQLMRAIEQSSQAEREAAARTQPARDHDGDPLGGELKKQSQFAAALMGTRACVARDYDGMTRAARAQNKANQPCPKRSRTDRFVEPTAPTAGDVNGRTSLAG